MFSDKITGLGSEENLFLKTLFIDWSVYSSKSLYVEVLTSSTSACEYIQEIGFLDRELK